MLATLFGGASLKPEDIVFEPIDVPGPKSSARARAVVDPAQVGPVRVETVPPGGRQAASSRAGARGPVRRVALGELMPRIPVAWRRSNDYIPEELIELPNEARLDVGVERALAFSLRYLAKVYPRWFRDPDPREPDPGVDLWMEPLKDPEAYLNEIPADAVTEVVEERETFAQWEWDAPNESPRQTQKESRETDKILGGVQMPPLGSRVAGGFDDLLRGSVEREESPKANDKASPKTGEQASLGSASPTTGTQTGAKPAKDQQRLKAKAAAKAQVVPNPRLRKILEAYAETLPEADTTPVGVKTDFRGQDLSVQDAAPAKQQASGGKGSATAPVPAPEHVSAGVSEAGQAIATRWAQPSIEPVQPAYKEARNVAVAQGNAVLSQPAGADAALMYQTRFEELGLSLSRFVEVRGFGLWQGGLAQHTGDLGFDARSSVAREKLERLLEGALSTQGAQDGFISVTVNHALGGISVFGGGPCLVAVTHQAEGLPAHLRAWLCGWAAQPLRG